MGMTRIAIIGGGKIGEALIAGLRDGGWPPQDLVVVAASGTSGAGKSAKPHLLGSEVMGSMSPYGVGGIHRHVPEIRQGLSRAAGAEVSLSFTPTLAPMPRGILATATARLSPGVGPAAVRAAWEAAYAELVFQDILWPDYGPKALAEAISAFGQRDRRFGGTK